MTKVSYCFRRLWFSVNAFRTRRLSSLVRNHWRTYFVHSVANFTSNWRRAAWIFITFADSQHSQAWSWSAWASIQSRIRRGWKARLASNDCRRRNQTVFVRISLGMALKLSCCLCDFWVWFFFFSLTSLSWWRATECYVGMENIRTARNVVAPDLRVNKQVLESDSFLFSAFRHA